jgi:hypothetical protein
MTDTLATKYDLTLLRQEVREIDARIDARFARVDARFEQIVGQMDARFEKVDGRFAQMEARFDHKLADLEHRMTLRLGGMMVATVGVCATLVRLF